jgi:hypothetical protein
VGSHDYPGGEFYYEGESLHFVGKETHCRIYDKVKEMQGKPGQVTQVEWQLRGDALLPAFNRDMLQLRNLVLEDCYDSYRSVCPEFEPKSLPESSAIHDLLAVGVKEGKKLSGIPIFDYWVRKKHPKTVRRRSCDSRDESCDSGRSCI